MLTIRFARTGKRNIAQFKIALQEHTVAPGGRHVEILGSYNPHSKEAVLKEERIKYWIGKGVQISDSVYNLFAGKGLVSGAKRKVKLPAKKAEETPVEAPKAAAAAAPEAPKAEGEPVEIKEEPKEEVRPEEAVEEPKTENVIKEKPAEEKSAKENKEEKAE